MYKNPKRRVAKPTQRLRNEGGHWLRELREKRGLTQRALAQKIEAEYYTCVSQIENGRGRIPAERYLDWAEALGVEPRSFVRQLMSYYDPVTYDILFDCDPPETIPASGTTATPRMHVARSTHTMDEQPCAAACETTSNID
jgi:DNA-binding XRE family transcriptional regulator